MSELDERVRRAFDDVVVPDDVKRATLSFIARIAEEGGQDAPTVSAHASSSERFVSRREGRETRSRAFSLSRRMFALAACLVLAVVGFGGFSVYTQPTAYVGIDVNPSIELGVNRFGIVVETTALNDDGRALLDAVPLVGRNYVDALTSLTQSDAFEPYAQEGSFVEISVASDSERQGADIRRQSDACLGKLPCRSACHAVDSATREAAASAGMGVGRYRAALELMELDPEVTLEECKNLSMRQMRDRIAALSGDGVERETPDSVGSRDACGRGECKGSSEKADEHRYGREGKRGGINSGDDGENAGA